MSLEWRLDIDCVGLVAAAYIPSFSFQADTSWRVDYSISGS